jgi:FMN reductase
MPTVGIVVGNPKPRSRTLQVATAVAAAAAQSVGLSEADRLTVDLADLGPQLFDWSSGPVRQAVDAVRGCALAVVASPTYKASYSGLLKAFLDWFGTTDLSSVVVVPLMVGAGLQHALAVEVHLRPVLVELGASLPTRGLYITEDLFAEERSADVDTLVTSWLDEAGPRLRRAVAGA